MTAGGGPDAGSGLRPRRLPHHWTAYDRLPRLFRPQRRPVRRREHGAGIEHHYYDQLGSAYSDQPEDPSLWDLERFVDEVEQVRRALDLDARNFFLLGHERFDHSRYPRSRRPGQHRPAEHGRYPVVDILDVVNLVDDQHDPPDVDDHRPYDHHPSHATTTTAASTTTTVHTTTTTAPTTTTAAQHCVASMSNTTPARGTTDTVNITSNVPSTPDTIAINYTSGTQTYHHSTDGTGADHYTFPLGNTASGHPVTVMVTISHASCSTSFTPQ